MNISICFSISINSSLATAAAPGSTPAFLPGSTTVLQPTPAPTPQESKDLLRMLLQYDLHEIATGRWPTRVLGKDAYIHK